MNVNLIDLYTSAYGDGLYAAYEYEYYDPFNTTTSADPENSAQAVRSNGQQLELPPGVEIDKHHLRVCKI